MTPEDKLAKMGLALPEVPAPAGNYVPWKRVGDIAYLAGQGPRCARPLLFRIRHGCGIQQGTGIGM